MKNNMLNTYNATNKTNTIAITTERKNQKRMRKRLQITYTLKNQLRNPRVFKATSGNVVKQKRKIKMR